MVAGISSTAEGLAFSYRYVLRIRNEDIAGKNGPLILPDVVGFFFADTPEYTPPQDLADFLQAGPPPVYIGFGSIVVDDPQKLIGIVLEAVRLAGVRAIVSKGWSELAGRPDENIYYIGDCPHGWLFQRVAAVVHHGGAGTTACGLQNGKPTTVVPFFGEYVHSTLEAVVDHPPYPRYG